MSISDIYVYVLNRTVLLVERSMPPAERLRQQNK